MKTPKASSVAPASEPDPPAPRGFTKAEKSEFRRVCGLRRKAGNPVRAVETDILADYVRTRARLEVWQKKLAWGQGVPQGSIYSRMILSEQLAVASTLDRAAAACRRLAKDLKLLG
ncbi:MAG: hypothetical protein GY873_39175 [Bosea sp.]|uniref:hypothetical protein n=1 Tax=Bosea sp. (in: a-proteobacteria) TaxID=1871050 RepID=UPI00238AD56C|nr:hypothetical protein [Bosea sp. (in: a-proteobacteria)]MCP4740227.1 hypothetical protein [Bosea sp. (in: a-proteobacteria)]